MKDMIKVLALSAFPTFWLLVASLLINLLALASAIYVIQVLNRYITYQIDATLYVLTTGVLLALILEYILRIARHTLAEQIVGIQNRHYAEKIFKHASRTHLPLDTNLYQTTLMRSFSYIKEKGQINGAEGIVSFIDAIFVFIFIGVVFLLSEKLGLLAVAAIAFLIVLIICKKLLLSSGAKNAAIKSNITERITSDLRIIPETVRAFNAASSLEEEFKKSHAELRWAEKNVRNTGSIFDQANILIPGLTTVGVMFFGAQDAISGELSVGALIGINILVSRAFGPILRLAQLVIKRATFIPYEKSVSDLLSMPLDLGGSNLGNIKGKISFDDVAVAYPGSTSPVFERLSCEVPPGGVVVVSGPNGSGKTTICKLLLGLIYPQRGTINYDGFDIRKINTPWLRSLICYLPQEVELFNLSLRENLLINALSNDDLKEVLTSGDLDRLLINVIEKSDLTDFVNSLPMGLDEVIVNRGRNYPVGIRRRIALARSLVAEGNIIVFDDPTEGLDPKGAAAVYNALNKFREEGKTIIVTSHDPNIIKGAGAMIDLSSKPVPAIGIRKAQNASK